MELNGDVLSLWHDVSDHRPLDCLFNCLFGLTTYKQRSSHYGSCEGNFQCIPTSGLYWCQCISNRMSMHHTKKHFFVWSIDQISVSPIINHHGHYPLSTTCWRQSNQSRHITWDIRRVTLAAACVVHLEGCICQCILDSYPWKRVPGFNILSV